MATPKFSSALLLSDLNDYIAPGQVCVNPVSVNSSKTPNAKANIKVDDTGGYYEVTRDGTETKLETASITLNDCLACSGCITSAESVLVNLQSHKETYAVVAANRAARESGNLSGVRKVVVSVSPQSRASIAAKYNLSTLQVARRITHFLRHVIGADAVYDTNFARDFSLIEQSREFVERWKVRENRKRKFSEAEDKEKECSELNALRGATDSSEGTAEVSSSARRALRKVGSGKKHEGGTHPAENDSRLPMLASACPGWICYAEKTHGHLLPYISETKSPQQIMGSIVKVQLASEMGLTPDQIYHVSVMPCYDKKLEASRSDFYSDVYRTRDVDCVITTKELESMFRENDFDIQTSPEADLEGPLSKLGGPNNDVLLRAAGSSSGAYLETVMRLAARELFGIRDLDPRKEGAGIIVKQGKNADFREVILQINGEEKLRFASAYGFRNTQNLVRKLKKTGSSSRRGITDGGPLYDFVEVMACPSGCVNGGGQLASVVWSVSGKEWIALVERSYQEDPEVWTGGSGESEIRELFDRWVGGVDSARAKELLRTSYRAVERLEGNGLAVKW